jgi:trk system potassium uptake protein TrkH
MNYRLIANYLSYFAAALGAAMVPSMLWAVYFKEYGTLLAFVWSAVSCLAVGGAFYYAGRKASLQIQHREALAFVGLSWIIVAGLGALPYVYAGCLSPIDAYFESMSGFTTTGSTVIVAIEETDYSLLFWRATTHWLGGMGIVVLFIAVLPYLGAGGKQLFKSETPGPNPRGLKPRIQDTASFLYKFYLAMTAAMTIALMLAGMSLFDALCHTFAALGTGGFSTRQASVAAFDSVLIEMVIIFFMIAAGANFSLYFAMVRGDWRALIRDSEFRTYIGILAVSTVVIALTLMGFGVQSVDALGDPLPENSNPYGFGKALRDSAFQVVSTMTTTGFASADFDTWPYVSRMLLVVLMCIGGCAGSTAGGLKVIRIMMLVKIVLYRLELTFRPKLVRAVRVAGEVIDDDVQSTVYAHLALFAGWFVFGSLLMSAMGLPFETAVSSVITTLSNVGPGLQLVGAARDFSQIPELGKVFLSLCMALGRLELFTLTVFLVPVFWKRT